MTGFIISLLASSLSHIITVIITKIRKIPSHNRFNATFIVFMICLIFQLGWQIYGNTIVYRSDAIACKNTTLENCSAFRIWIIMLVILCIGYASFFGLIVYLIYSWL